jgi:hypothetical protein
MIKADFFFSKKGQISGFCIRGHAMYGDPGEDIVCASVSSAAYMTANTLTEIVKVKTAIEDANDGMMKIVVSTADRDRAKYFLEGLKLHITELAKMYPRNIRVNKKYIF